MWYYITHNYVCIGVYDNIEDVNHFLARKGYTIINTYQKRELETIVEVEKW